MIAYISQKRKSVALFLAATFLFQILYPSIGYALTSGPTQPEVQSFQPAGTTDMVDLFSGDFSYNIPLFELPGPNGGYPFNLSYQAGIGMDQEASWVGLGWSLSPGSIVRQMRGLPDDFKGDLVKTTMSVSPSVTVGLGAGGAVEVFGGDGSLKAGFSVSHNNFKGIGYSIDGSLGFARAAGGGTTAGIGLDISLDSKEGVNLQPSLSLSGKIGEVGLGAGYNSKSGLSNISFNHSINYTINGKGEKNIKGVRADKKGSGVSSNSSPLTVAHPGYSPQISMAMKNLNLSAEFHPGAASWAIFPNMYVRGFYNEQTLDKDKAVISTPAFGYLNYQHGSSKALLDFNREKDGLVTKESPNLGIPSLTYDIYTVTGQGIGSMYRPMRNDIGVISDPETTSVSNGGSIGIDAGPAASHVGINLSVNHSKSTSGPWADNNPMQAAAAFQKQRVNEFYEPWYFKVHGDPTAVSVSSVNEIGADKAVRIKLPTSGRNNPSASSTIESKNWSESESQMPDKTITQQTGGTARKTRSQVVQSFTREQLIGTTGSEVLPQFRVSYIEGTGAEISYNRNTSAPSQAHHVSAITALTPDGLRYNYGIPAYNVRQDEVAFSATKTTNDLDPNLNTQVSGLVKVNLTGDAETSYPSLPDDTDKFLKNVVIPPYVHSHLLTSILGNDYVDLTGNGVSEDDLGYWVKFTYVRKNSASNPYNWRDPYRRAHYQEGWITDPADDKGSFTYGKKEIWYLAKAETKSHVAVFDLTAREDGKGVSQKLQDSPLQGASLFKLDKIKLYTRDAYKRIGEAPAPVPLKTVVLKYDPAYPLCPGIPNGTSDKGKLTLNELWFEHGGSTRGSLNPYRFTYINDPAVKYNAYNADRWGTYKPGAAETNRDFPYSLQDPTQASIDANAAMWSLYDISLPSGGKITVNYESDDYAYVQHKPAMKMLEIVHPTTFANTGNFAIDPNLAADRTIRFKLERQISTTEVPNSPEAREAYAKKYLDLKNKQIYFKVKINLRKAGESFHEFISGYATISTAANSCGLENPVNNIYSYGFFTLNAENANGPGRHPFSVRAWQHIRTNQPQLANSGRKLSRTDKSGERVDQIKSLGSIGAQVRKMFGGFYTYCNDKWWGRELVLGKSWVRLYSPDKIKYGGGLRVRQITMTDQWADDKEGVYGQVYQYTMMDGTQLISSGVASYEPIIGGDENSLRYAKPYVQSVPLRADNNLFFEYPINETYYPGPQVGYRKVTVWSLAAAHLASVNYPSKFKGLSVNNITLPGPGGKKVFPTTPGLGYGTSGKTEHEFFTARDFPVITEETSKVNVPYKLHVPVPFLGTLSISKMATSQGYSIITNDMHGKQKMVSNFRQTKDGDVEPEAISWVKYNYFSKDKIYEQEKVKVLQNQFKDNGDGTLGILTSGTADFMIGQETEFFFDMRQYEDKSWSGGARFNTDIIYLPFAPVPVPTVWPSIGKTQNQLRTAVANKVIFKSGILRSVEAYDGGSRVVTENLKWDKLTGVPVLIKVNNNYDDPIFSYNILAHSKYEGMGAAYQNTGFTFSISSVVKDPYKVGHYDFFTNVPAGALCPGDEIILHDATSEFNKPIARATYLGNFEGDEYLYCQQTLTATSYRCMIARSGFRNQLSVSAGNITSLSTDPSVPGPPVDPAYSKKINIAK
jgi:hypothetical protein